MTQAQNRAQRLQDVLETLTTRTPDVLGASIVSSDGLLIARVLPTGSEEASIGGMASILHSLGSRVVGELRLGSLKRVMINGEDGNVLMVRAGDGALLITLMRRDAALGLVFLDVARASEAIENIL